MCIQVKNSTQQAWFIDQFKELKILLNKKYFIKNKFSALAQSRLHAASKLKISPNSIGLVTVSEIVLSRDTHRGTSWKIFYL